MIPDSRIRELVLGCWREVGPDYQKGNPDVDTDDLRIEAAIRKALEEDRALRPEAGAIDLLRRAFKALEDECFYTSSRQGGKYTTPSAKVLNDIEAFLKSREPQGESK